MPRIYKCPECGSAAVSVQATAYYDTQVCQWLPSEIDLSEGYCSDCEAEDIRIVETEPIDPHLVLLMEVADGLESALKHITKDGMTDENEELYHLGIAAIDNARDYLKAHEAGRKN
jgi:hypothetical protein